MTVSLHINGRPDSCRQAAHDQRALADAHSECARFLLHAAGLSATDLGGEAGRAFRHRARSVGRLAADLAQVSREAAEGLDRLAQGLAEAIELCARARRLAEPWGLVIEDRLYPPSEVPDDRFVHVADPRWEDWRSAKAIAGRAHQAAEAAREEWRSALTRLQRVEPRWEDAWPSTSEAGHART